MDLTRYGIAATLGFAIGPDSRIDLAYEYFHDRRTTDRGIPSRAGRPLEGFDSAFFGDPVNSFSDADVQIATLGVEQKFGDNLPAVLWTELDSLKARLGATE